MKQINQILRDRCDQNINIINLDNASTRHDQTHHIKMKYTMLYNIYLFIY